MKTGILKFNVNERGRDHTGSPRNFDTAALAELVNSPEMQERVKNRDLLGYAGHWIRKRFGLKPPESAIDGKTGKLVAIEPAFVTTHLKAYPDGTIEHEAEIFENVTGTAVVGAFNDKRGGFSSVIPAIVRNGLDFAKNFIGFDFVNEPNNTNNRPYDLLFDDTGELIVDEDINALFDDAVFEFGQTLEHQQMLYSSLLRSHQEALAVIERLQIENNHVIGIAAAAGRTVMDSVPFERPMRSGRAADIMRKHDSFKDATLAPLDEIPEKKTSSVAEARAAARELLR